MSAFVVSQNHIRYLVHTAILADCYPWDELRDPTKLGQWLWDANVKSVDYRYQNNSDYNATRHEYVYVHGPSSDFMDPFQAVKALNCFDYQSCECPDYNESDVKFYIDRLVGAIARDTKYRHKPGYETSKWSL